MINRDWVMVRGKAEVTLPLLLMLVLLSPGSPSSSSCPGGGSHQHPPRSVKVGVILTEREMEEGREAPFQASDYVHDQVGGGGGEMMCQRAVSYYSSKMQ